MLDIETIIKIKEEMLTANPGCVPVMQIPEKMVVHIKAMPEFEEVKGIIGMFGRVAGVECHYG